MNKALASLMLVALLAVPMSRSRGDEDTAFVLGLTADTPDCVGNTMEVSDCISAQADKADRWLKSIVASYVRRLGASTEEAKKAGFGFYDGYDPVGNLRKSQDLFEKYRETMASFAYDAAYPGSMRQLDLPAARYQLTIDRIRFLLVSCRYLNPTDPLPPRVDLSKTDWCDPH
jgi:hypothetical protein